VPAWQANVVRVLTLVVVTVDPDNVSVTYRVLEKHALDSVVVIVTGGSPMVSVSII
jgi:hypothetical protein